MDHGRFIDYGIFCMWFLFQKQCRISKQWSFISKQNQCVQLKYIWEYILPWISTFNIDEAKSASEAYIRMLWKAVADRTTYTDLSESSCSYT